MINLSYANISKNPVPVNPNRIVFFSPVSLHFNASSMATLIAWDDSGAGNIVSYFANIFAASNTFVCSTATAFIYPSWYNFEIIGDIPWYLKPPAWLAEGMYSQPSVYIFANGQIFPVSQKSYAYFPLVNDGQDAGSTAINSVFGWTPVILSLINGAIKPPRFDPPPAHPITTSG